MSEEQEIGAYYLFVEPETEICFRLGSTIASMRAGSVIRVLLVDNQKTIQQILKGHLELEPDLEIVGITSDGQAAIEQVEALKPDIVLIDIEIPGIDGLTATHSISQRFKNTKVLVLSSYDDETYIGRALQVGAKGYLLKETSGKELANAIRSVYQGYFQLGPGLLEKVLHQVLSTPDNSVAASDSSAYKALEERLNTLEKVSERFFYSQRKVEKQLGETLKSHHHRNDLAHRQISRMSQRILTLEKQVIQINKLLNTAISFFILATLLGGFFLSVFWLGLV